MAEELVQSHVHELTCYETTLNCCGNFWGGLRAWLPCCCFWCPYPYVQVEQGFKGLLQKFGKFQNIIEPGFYFVNPCTENVIFVSSKTQVVDLQRQLILTKDNIVVNIDTVVYYRIIDPVKSSYRVQEIQNAVVEITYATLRTICGEHSLQDILEQRQKIADEIEKYVFDTVKEWGVYMEQVFIKDMILSKELQKELSMVTKTRRMAQSKIISAQSDVAVAQLLRQSADMLDSKSAMQIRYFDSLQKIAAGQNQKVLFLPINGKGDR